MGSHHTDLLTSHPYTIVIIADNNQPNGNQAQHKRTRRQSKEPAVSVILPVRNGGELLETAVASILDQTIENLELILIDDHSTDGAARRLEHADPRITLIFNGNPGLINALNAGIGASRAPWIARMDADDIASPHRLTAQLAYAASHPDIDVIGCQVRMFTDVGDIDEGYRVYETWINSLTTPEHIAREIFVESPIPHPSAVISRRCLDAIGVYRDMGWPEDYDLWLRAHFAGFKMGKPEGVLLDWRDYPTRTSRTDQRYSNDEFMRARAHFLAQDPRTSSGIAIWGAGKNGRRLHDCLKDHNVNVTGFIDIHPRRIGGTVRGLPVVSVDQAREINEFIVVAIGSRGVRETVRDAMATTAKIEGLDFIFAL